MENQEKLNLQGSCECGHSKFIVKAKPLFRFFCHCKICQKLYHKPFADVTAIWAGNIELPADNDIHFQKYRLPPALDRGTCDSCGLPVLGFLRLAPFLKLAFVPSTNYSNMDILPKPEAHIFYHRRTADIS